MMRALWTAASGMITQQTNVDTISNNIANINTTGFKSETAQFKSLLYQTMQNRATDSKGNEKPGTIQVGLGVRNSAVVSNFEQGAFTSTGNTFDMAIQGKGFFQVQLPDGTTGYTRNGSFTAAIKDNKITLADANGNRLLDAEGKPIELDPNTNMAKLTIAEDGTLSAPTANGNTQNLGVRIGLAQFNNPAGLLKSGESVFLQSDASGEPRLEGTDTGISASTIKQGYVEASNVSAADEMVNLIVAQRAYEMNSKAISASDTMLQQANNLRS